MTYAENWYLHVRMYIPKNNEKFKEVGIDNICDRPQKNWPNLCLVMVEVIPFLKVLIGVTRFAQIL